MAMSIRNRPDKFYHLIRKFSVGDGCWEWDGCRIWNGYGHFWLDGKMKLAHRVVYELLAGPIPEGLVLDHTCENRGCVNPGHLDLVTQQENSKRGKTGQKSGLQMKSKTHCPSGHPYSGDNLYIRPNGSRKCRECDRIRHRKTNFSPVEAFTLQER